MSGTLTISSTNPAIIEGVPYTWGKAVNWFVKLNGVEHIFNSQGVTPLPGINHKLENLTGFRYAKSISLK